MRAAVIYQHGGPDVIEVVNDFPDPVPTPDEVVINVGCTSLNYHDVFTRRGMPGIKIPMPMIMGMDLAGTVSAVGENVRGVRIGERVLVNPADRSDLHGGLIGETRHGGLAQKCAVPAKQIIVLPKNVSLEAAAALPVAYGTAHRMIVQKGLVKAGDKILILGASGGVGTGCVLLAKLLGAYVIACAGGPEKCRQLRDLGADEVIDYQAENFAQVVRQRFGKPSRRSSKGGVDVVVNFTGGDTWVESLKCLRLGGVMLTCGATAGFAPPEDIRFIWTFELQIQGSNGWYPEDLVALLNMIEEKRLSPVLDSEFSLDDVHGAFRRLEDRTVFGKVLVKP